MRLRDVYEEIADSWSNFRIKPVSFLPKKLKGRIIDVGCGNARNIIPFAKQGLRCVGVDFSKGMIKNALKMCKKNNVEVSLVVADAADLPFKDKSFENCISIATLHHLNTKESRVKSLKEMKRVCKGNVYISVWYRWQFYHMKNLLKNILHFGDVFVDWKRNGKVLKRYYHLYTKKELQKDAEEAGLVVESIKIVKENKKKNLFLHGRSR